MITLDTSAIYSLLNRSDEHHTTTNTVLATERGPLVVPVSILSELAYLVETRHGQSVLNQFFEDIEQAEYLLDCGEDDFPRIRQLIARYSDLPLGFADAAVIACAERRRGRILTYDQRHFPVVAREGTITLLPDA